VRPGGDDGYRWTILAVGVGAQAALSTVQLGLPSLGPALRTEFGLSLGGVGAVLAAAGWGVLVTQLPWGWAADRIGERKVIAAGLGGSALALAGAAYADSLGMFVAFLVLAGALGGSAGSASGRAVMGWFAREQRGFALGVRQMAVPIGGALGALTLPLLADAGGLRAAMLALAGVAVLGAAAGALWLREPPPLPVGWPVHQAPPPLRDRRVWRLSIASGLLVCAQIAVLTFAVIFLHDEHGLSVGEAALALAGIQLGGAIARLWAGRRSDVRGRRVAPLRATALAMAAGCVVTGVLAGASVAVVLPVLIVTGVLTMAWNGLSFTATAELSGRDRAGTAIGLQQTVMRLLSAGAGVAFGALVATTSWTAGFLILAVTPLAGWLVLAPLEPEEEGRIAEREARLRGRPVNVPATR
jgi:sugar phosphate permease